MKTEEQILNEYARLVPVACFNGHQEEWDHFVVCCKEFQANTFSVNGLRKILLQDILGKCDGNSIFLLNLMTGEIGSLLIDEALDLHRVLPHKVFDPNYLLRFESLEETLEKCFQSSILPVIPEPVSQNIKVLNEKYKNASLFDVVRGCRKEKINNYMRMLTGIRTADFNYDRLADEGVVMANFQTKSIKLYFKNAYGYEVIQ